MLVGSVEATLLILLLVIVFGPILSERFGIPGIVGLIAGGMLFGPFVVGWLEAGGLVADLGAIGILYLMFLAGLSFNIKAFVENRNSALVYGLLGFVLPFALSIAVVMGLSEIGFLGAALIGAMWASNTLVAYPDVRAAGLEGNRAVSAAVSAGVVADLLSLSVLAIATTTTVIEIDPLAESTGADLLELVGPETVQPTTPDPLLPLWLALPILLAFCLWILPRITNWFFITAGRGRTQRFLFALAGMAAGAVVALLGGIEGLIGAFLAGLGMNQLVPTKGTLMDRLDFVGSTVFVPAFLVSIGLNIDPALLFDRDTIVLGLLFTAFVVAGKSAAAIVTGVLFRFSWSEVGLMSSLSFGQAASTLAIAQVGLTLGFFDQIVVNAAVLAIVATALITSYGTRMFIERVPLPPEVRPEVGENVLLDVRPNGSSLGETVKLAVAIARPDDGLVVPYAIPGPGELDTAKAAVGEGVAAVAAQGLDADGLVRVDDSFTDGTLHLVEENKASLVVLSWGGPRFASDYMFGNDIDRVGEASPVPTMAVRVLRPWNRIVLGLGKLDTGWRRDDAELTMAIVRRLRRSVPASVLVVGPDVSIAVDRVGDAEGVEFVTDPSRRHAMIERIEPDDLVLVPAHVLHDLAPLAGWRVTRSLADANVGVVAGPHRLTVSKGVTRQPMTTPTWTPA